MCIIYLWHVCGQQCVCVSLCGRFQQQRVNSLVSEQTCFTLACMRLGKSQVFAFLYGCSLLFSRLIERDQGEGNVVGIYNLSTCPKYIKLSLRVFL